MNQDGLSMEEKLRLFQEKKRLQKEAQKAPTIHTNYSQRLATTAKQSTRPPTSIKKVTTTKTETNKIATPAIPKPAKPAVSKLIENEKSSSKIQKSKTTTEKAKVQPPSAKVVPSTPKEAPRVVVQVTPKPIEESSDVTREEKLFLWKKQKAAELSKTILKMQELKPSKTTDAAIQQLISILKTQIKMIKDIRKLGNYPKVKLLLSEFVDNIDPLDISDFTMMSPTIQVLMTMAEYWVERAIVEEKYENLETVLLIYERANIIQSQPRSLLFESFNYFTQRLLIPSSVTIELMNSDMWVRLASVPYLSRELLEVISVKYLPFDQSKEFSYSLDNSSYFDTNDSNISQELPIRNSVTKNDIFDHEKTEENLIVINEKDTEEKYTDEKYADDFIDDSNVSNEESQIQKETVEERYTEIVEQNIKLDIQSDNNNNINNINNNVEQVDEVNDSESDCEQENESVNQQVEVNDIENEDIYNSDNSDNEVEEELVDETYNQNEDLSNNSDNEEEEMVEQSTRFEETIENQTEDKDEIEEMNSTDNDVDNSNLSDVQEDLEARTEREHKKIDDIFDQDNLNRSPTLIPLPTYAHFSPLSPKRKEEKTAIEVTKMQVRNTPPPPLFKTPAKSLFSPTPFGKSATTNASPFPRSAIASPFKTPGGIFSALNEVKNFNAEVSANTPNKSPAVNQTPLRSKKEVEEFYEKISTQDDVINTTTVDEIVEKLFSDDEEEETPVSTVSSDSFQTPKVYPKKSILSPFPDNYPVDSLPVFSNCNKKKKKKVNTESERIEDSCGSLTVITTANTTNKERELLGSDKKLTSVRRSSRLLRNVLSEKQPNRKKKLNKNYLVVDTSNDATSWKKVLEACGNTFAPNPLLKTEKLPSTLYITEKLSSLSLNTESLNNLAENSIYYNKKSEKVKVLKPTKKPRRRNDENKDNGEVEEEVEEKEEEIEEQEDEPSELEKEITEKMGKKNNKGETGKVNTILDSLVTPARSKRKARVEVLTPSRRSSRLSTRTPQKPY